MRANWIPWFLLVIFFRIVAGQPQPPAHNGTDLICRPFGTCEPCPDDALNEPFCQPFGNRRLMHCVPANSTHAPPPHFPGGLQHGSHDTLRSPPPDFDNDAPLDPDRQGEIPAWEMCGRIVEKERADFYEFVACNLVIALLGIVVLFARSKRLQAMHARQLAARIGLVRGVPGGWVG